MITFNYTHKPCLNCGHSIVVHGKDGCEVGHDLDDPNEECNCSMYEEDIK